MEAENVLNKYDHLAFSVFMFIEVLLLPLMIYLILFRSRSMSRYRYFLLNNVIWSFLFDIWPFLIRPSFLFPGSCIVFYPMISMSNEVMRYFVHVLFVTLLFMELSVFWGMWYRYAKVILL